MATYDKTVTGKLLRTDFDSLTGWSGDTGSFSVSNQGAILTFGFIPNFDFASQPNGYDHVGCRQGDMFIENGVWYLNYDGYLSPTGAVIPPIKSTTNMVVSYDRGLTWKRILGWGPLDDNGAGGTLTYGWANGSKDKFGSTYYITRVTLLGSGGDPPYLGDIFSAPDLLNGPWTLVYAMVTHSSTRAATEHLPGKLLKVGSTYYLYDQGRNAAGSPSNYNCGFMSGASLATLTLNTGIITNSANIGIPSGTNVPENPKVLFSTALNAYVMLANSYTESGFISTHNSTVISSTPDFASKTIRQFMKQCPMDGEHSMGVISPYTGPDGTAIVGENGFIPAVFDSEGRMNSPGVVNYAYRRILRTCLLEPSANAFQYTGSGATLQSIFSSQTNGDFVAEFGFEFLSVVASTYGGIWYRGDGTENNGYRVKVNNNGKVDLDKFVSGVNTSVATGSGTLTADLNMSHRIKLVVSGTSHRIYIDGELQVNATDASIASGTHIGVYGFGNVNAQIRLLNMRTSDVVTVTGLQPHSNIILRADGAVPAGIALANGSGQASFTLSHWPMERFEIDGTDYVIDGGIWGGDTYVFTGFPAEVEYQGSKWALR